MVGLEPIRAVIAQKVGRTLDNMHMYLRANTKGQAPIPAHIHTYSLPTI